MGESRCFYQTIVGQIFDHSRYVEDHAEAIMNVPQRLWRMP